MAELELSPQQLDAAGKNLQTLKTELEQLLLLSEESSSAVELDQSKVGRLSRMDAMQHQAMAVAKRSAYQRQLRSVLAALARLERGDYGYCIECDEPIAFARLEIKPEAALCLKCQQKSGG